MRRASTRLGRIARCSTPITRCGSARNSAISTTATAAIGAQLAFWEQALGGMPERLQLPTDRPYPPVADHHGARVAVDWPAELQQQIARVARAHNATGFMVVQAAFAALLSKVSASTDVAVGFPIAGRRDAALDDLVGMFVNTLVLRVDLAGNPTFAELLAQVRRRSLAAFEHQDVPFELLVERLNPARSLTHHPLIQVLLGWENFAGHEANPAAGLPLGDLHVTPMPVDTHTARMDLTFSLAERWTEDGEHAGIGVMAEFRTDVFDAGSIEAMIDRLQRVLTAVTADPAAAVVVGGSAAIPLSTPGCRGGATVTVLTQPAHAGVGAGVVRRAGGPHTGGGGAGLRGPVDDVPGARRGGQPVGAPAGRPRCGPGSVCGADVFAFARGDRGDPGGAQVRGGLSADRPGAAGGTDRVHARRRRSDRRAHHQRAGRPARRVRRVGHRRRRPRRTDANPAQRRRRRLPTTSPTSSTPRAPPAFPKVLR